MTTNPDLRRAVRRAAVAATRAASAADSQPWRVVRRGVSIEIHADRDRQLRHLDPDGRALLMSCGCALANVRLSLAGDGIAARVERLPQSERPDLVAVVTVGTPAADPIPETRFDAGTGPGLTRMPWLVGVPEAARSRIAAIIDTARRRAWADPSVRAELRAYGWSAAPTDDTDEQPGAAIGVVVGDADAALDWVLAGERYQSAALDLAATGWFATIIVPATTCAQSRAAVRQVLDLDRIPQLLFALERGARRGGGHRRLVDVLVDAE